MWPAVDIRPDISYLVGVFSKYFENPGPIYFNLVFQHFGYLAGTLILDITFRSQITDELIGYINSDQARLKNEKNTAANTLFFAQTNLCLTNQSKKLLIIFF